MFVYLVAVQLQLRGWLIPAGAGKLVKIVQNQVDKLVFLQTHVTVLLVRGRVAIWATVVDQLDT